jgi:predicted nucleic acid-binding protein
MSSYADTSFLASLYTFDIHSDSAATAMAEAELPLFLTSFGELELVNAIELRAYRKELKRSEVRQALTMFRRDIGAGVYFLKPLAATVFDRALKLAQKRTPRLGTRTLDILHVASAIDLRVKTFYTFDKRQKKLANSAKLHVLP